MIVNNKKLLVEYMKKKYEIKKHVLSLGYFSLTTMPLGIEIKYNIYLKYFFQKLSIHIKVSIPTGFETITEREICLQMAQMCQYYGFDNFEVYFKGFFHPRLYYINNFKIKKSN